MGQGEGRFMASDPANARGGKGRVLPVYIGDDRTDEDVFLTLRKNGITVFVGRGDGRRPAIMSTIPEKCFDFFA